MSESDEEKLEQIKQLFLDAASHFNVHPTQVTRRQFSKLHHHIGLAAMSRLGGFSEIKFSLFPAPIDHPLGADILKRMSEKSLSDYIASIIEQCSESTGTPPHELTFDEFRKYINFRYGINSKGIERYSISKAGGFNAIRDSHFVIKPTPVIVEKKRVFEHAKMNRKLGQDAAEMQFIIDRTLEGLKQLSSQSIVVQCPGSHALPQNGQKRILNLMLSDLHIGADIDGEETGYLGFGKIEESRRLAHICREVVNWKPEHRQNTELNVLLLGDIIQGYLKHDPRDGANISEQILRAIWLLKQVISYLAEHFPAVTVLCTSGNHGRFIARHPGRAINQKFDSLEQIVYYALEMAVPKAKFISPKTPYIDFPLFGKRATFTHGDTFFSVGNPSKAFPTAKIEEQINRLNAKLPDDQEYVICGVGHVHFGCQAFLNNGCVILVNSSLCPPDPFATSLGIVESKQGQWLFESTASRPFGDAYFIQVGQNHDMDETLDQIIMPYVSKW